MNPTAVEALGWALVHFVWQGAAIALAAGFVNLALRRARPEARHALFCGALASMVLAPVITLLLGAPASLPPGAVSAATAVEALGAAAPAAPESAAAEGLLWLVRIWICGVGILAVRSLGGFALAQRMTRFRASPAARGFQIAAAGLCSRLDIRRPVRILASALVEVPAAIGWLRPVVLVPVSALTTLSPAQIELLLVHELAHVRRYDYLVNLVQTMVETLLFYHPAVWWVSRQIRIERENCCDDLAVAACGDAAAYARTLAALEGMRTASRALVVAADDGSLLARITRLARRDGLRRNPPPLWFGALMPAAAVAATLLSVEPPAVVAQSAGFLRGLADAGYTKLTVDEIIALKENGVEPEYIKPMLSAGLGALSVDQMIRLRHNGVEPAFVAGAVTSGLVSDLDVPNVIRLRDNGVDVAELARIRGAGFGPYATEDAIRLRANGVDLDSFQALKEMGLTHAGVAEAIEVRQNGITPERIRSMKRQGFNNLTLEQIIKLNRGGII